METLSIDLERTLGARAAGGRALTKSTPDPQPPAHLSLGIDIGDPTDVILADHAYGRFYTAKRLSTPEDLAVGALQAVEDVLAASEAAPAGVGCVVHATTQATNLILEGKRPPVALLTTAGFRDLFRIYGVRHDQPFDLLWSGHAAVRRRRSRSKCRSASIAPDG